MRRALGLPRGQRARGSSQDGAPDVLEQLGTDGPVELAHSVSCPTLYHKNRRVVHGLYVAHRSDASVNVGFELPRGPPLLEQAVRPGPQAIDE
jgi:hypothetical protein